MDFRKQFLPGALNTTAHQDGMGPSSLFASCGHATSTITDNLHPERMRFHPSARDQIFSANTADVFFRDTCDADG